MTGPDNKKVAALSMGLNYERCSPRMRLNGCFNDTDNVTAYLSNSRGYAPADIRQLKDPRKAEMLRELRDLSRRSHAQQLYEAFVHYSGHGSQRPDDSSDEKEIDGKDEVLIPADYYRSGFLRDDALHEILRRFNPNTRVICLLDCCHSGTACDLAHRYTLPRGPHADIAHETCKEEPDDADLPLVVAISGCRDDQVSMDAYNVMGEHQHTGAMSSCLLSALESLGGAPSLEKVFRKLHEELYRKGFRQRPVLTTSREIDLGKTPF